MTAETTGVCVIGSGAWGTALACVAARAGCDTTLICRNAAQADELNTKRTNSRYLGDIVLTDQFHATTDQTVLAQADIILLAIPVQTLGTALADLAPKIPPTAILINSAKGLERSTGRRLSEVISAICPANRIGVISGPSFAKDVSQGLPTAVTLAMENADDAIAVAGTISSPSFRCYASHDILGVEIGGALKNVLALACGILQGAGLGDSAKAALITRGFVELLRIGRTMGALDESLMGLSGFGDLQLTCSSLQSRNYTYGIALGQGADLTGRPLAEGVATTDVAVDLAHTLGVDAPILTATQAILSGKMSVSAAVDLLLNRPLRAEISV